MYGCGIGPVTRPGDVALVRRVLNTCVDAITLREDASLAELKRFGVDKPETVLAADPVLSLQPAPEEETDALMAKLGLESGGAYLGVCLRTWKGFEDKAPVIAGAVFGWCMVRKNAASATDEDSDAKMWQKRAFTAVVGGVGGMLGSTIITLVTSYFI